MKHLNVNNWNRKEHFEFFKTFDDPWFGIVMEIDFTIAFKKCKAKNILFFLDYLHKSLLGANKVQEFRFRLDDDKVKVYDVIHSSSTIGCEDGTFVFLFIPFKEDFNDFYQEFLKESKRIKAQKGLCLSEESERDEAIHYTTIPWIKMTSVKHPMEF